MSSGSLGVTVPRQPEPDSGFSLPLVLVASLMVLLGGLMLANRSSDGVISAAFQRDGNDARDAAETGLTRILGELNREPNRGLLAKAGSAADGGDFLWGEADALNARNHCSASGTDLSTNPNIGFSSTAPYQRVLLNADGQVVSDLSQASKAYRLLWVKRQPLSDADGNALLKIFQPSGRGSVQLAVEGMAVRNGQVLSAVRLERDVQLVPKCCAVPFGGAHGNVFYGYDADYNSVCFPFGIGSWGILGGAAQTNTGYIEINGVTTIQSDGSDPQIINPLYCLADSAEGCAFKPTSTPYTLQLAPPVLPEVPSNPVVAAATRGLIERSGGSLSGDIKDSASAFAQCQDDAGAIVPACKAADTKLVVLDAGVDMASSNPHRPSYCALHDSDGDGNDELHCNLSKLDYSAFNVRVLTSSRPLRLYFPISGTVMSSSAGSWLEHVRAPGAAITDLSLYGCASCGSQVVSLNGAVQTLDLFAWFPNGTVTISGGSGYSGVLWANRVTSNGGVTWTVPGSGVAAALEQIGYGISPDGISPTDRNPPVFDWVGRSTQRFRWFGQ
jgi:hypothetical protein